MSLRFRSLFIKYLLFIFNLIFGLTGVILLVVGAVIQASYTFYNPILDEGFFSVPILLVVIGSVIFVVSFFGCCGAYKENYCLTVSFCVSLILLFILELSVGIAGYVLRDRVSETLEGELNKTMALYHKSGQVHIMWDEIQTNLHCCGDTSAKSWLNYLDSLPQSCCEPSVTQCIPENAFKDSCIDGLKYLLQNYAGVLGGVGIGIVVIQLLGIVFACNLASSIKGYESV